MQKIILNNGYIAYKVSVEELTVIKGEKTCDNCNKFVFVGYLVPVLDQWLCEKCLREWEYASKYYPEYVPVELRNCAQYEKIISNIK